MAGCVVEGLKFFIGPLFLVDSLKSHERGNIEIHEKKQNGCCENEMVGNGNVFGCDSHLLLLLLSTTA